MKFDFGSLPGRLGKKLQNVFGSANQRALTRFQPTLDKINELATWADGMSREQIVDKVSEWRQKVESGQASLEDALPEMDPPKVVDVRAHAGLRVCAAVDVVEQLSRKLPSGQLAVVDDACRRQIQWFVLHRRPRSPRARRASRPTLIPSAAFKPGEHRAVVNRASTL